VAATNIYCTVQFDFNTGLFTHANKGIRKLSIEERVQYYGSNAQPV
jgi:magnesium-transporting ATPase (P-type)